MALVGLLPACPAFAQVASVKCCISEDNLTRIGECLSGPDDTDVPAACGSIGTCVLGFGEHAVLTRELCDPDQPPLPDDPRAVCMSWIAMGATVTQECVAAPNTDFSLFDMCDADHDGDLDLRDMAAFQQVYESVPKEVQSKARLVFVECCEPARRTPEPSADGSDAAMPEETVDVAEPFCILGFSGIIEPGDYLYELCEPGSDGLPEPGDATCVSWSAGYVSVAHLCQAADVCDYRCPCGDGERLDEQESLAVSRKTPGRE
jgi:hypothetical protein